MIFRIVFFTLSSGIILYVLWIFSVSIAGMSASQKEYIYDRAYRTAVIICARNEERVIGRTLDSLKAQNYPKDCYDIFVVAHNCSDKTADIARRHGAFVIERDDPGEKTKAAALQYGLGQIGEGYECFAVIDADCLADENFLREISAGFSDGADVVCGYYDCKNYDDSIISRLSGLLYYGIMDVTCVPHGRLGLPVNVYGSGWAARMSLAGKAFGLRTMNDDFEFSIRVVLDGAKCIENPKAVIYAEMPVTLRAALAQRKRWAMGHTQCWRNYGKEVRRSIPKLGWNGIKIYADLIMNPVITATAAGLLSGIAILVSEGLLRGAIIYIAVSIALFYFLMSMCSFMTLKKKRSMTFKDAAACLIFPAWTAVSAFYGVTTFFRRDLEWKGTEHSSEKGIEDMEKSR